MLPKCGEKRTLCMVVGKAVGAATVENSVEFPQKTKHKTIYHMIQQFHSGVCIQRRGSQDLTDVSALLCSAALFPVAGCGHNLDVCR